MEGVHFAKCGGGHIVKWRGAYRKVEGVYFAKCGGGHIVKWRGCILLSVEGVYIAKWRVVGVYCIFYRVSVIII